MIRPRRETGQDWTDELSKVVKVRKPLGNSPPTPILAVHHDDIVGAPAEDPSSGALHSHGARATVVDGAGHSLGPWGPVACTTSVHA